MADILIPYIKDEDGTLVPIAVIYDKDGNEITETYLTKADASTTYLSAETASSTYLSITDADSTYAKKTETTAISISRDSEGYLCVNENE